MNTTPKIDPDPHLAAARRVVNAGNGSIANIAAELRRIDPAMDEAGSLNTAEVLLGEFDVEPDLGAPGTLALCIEASKPRAFAAWPDGPDVGLAAFRAIVWRRRQVVFDGATDN